MTFEEFISHMFDENCVERRAWGEEPYENISEYYSAGYNSSYLVKTWSEQYAN